ncbi:hypothetical protein AALP_AA1G110300 [Arabis alpina]|uniref:Pentatricopeptide repeat-containing protein n=1 Tax=Arabis alpina TaxID=50452 RepID=A0A087HMH5_ARAAL|nr:hypothetical protein AALP_AA1G110300 [Arabis alpina]
MACTTVATPFSVDVETSKADEVSASAKTEKGKMQREKRKIYQKLRCLTVETVDLIIRDEEKNNGVSFTQADVVNWAKRLNKECKFRSALVIFEWMDKKKMIISPSELAIYVHLIFMIKGATTAQEYFEKVEPNFDNMDRKSKNWPAYKILMEFCGE